jgi:biotin carboxyl carrier protein
MLSKTAEQPVTELRLVDGRVDSSHVIEAPMVGYFSFADPPLTPGASVEAGETIGTITALGIVNEITATVSGQVDEVVVAEGEAVEFGQELIRLLEA